MHEDIERILLSESEIRAGIEHVADKVTRHYAPDGLTVVAVLKGSVVFVADLIRRIPLALELGFAGVESYRGGTVAGRLEIHGLPGAEEVRGRRVLLVDDILDSGRTLLSLRDELLGRGARDVRTCVFLDKPARRAVDLCADFAAFTIDDLFVVGYGLDFAGRYRNLPYLGALKPRVLAAASSGSAP